jgi:hypothetical protein
LNIPTTASLCSGIVNGLLSDALGLLVDVGEEDGLLCLKASSLTLMFELLPAFEPLRALVNRCVYESERVAGDRFIPNVLLFSFVVVVFPVTKDQSLFLSLVTCDTTVTLLITILIITINEIVLILSNLFHCFPWSLFSSILDETDAVA